MIADKGFGEYFVENVGNYINKNLERKAKRQRRVIEQMEKRIAKFVRFSARFIKCTNCGLFIEENDGIDEFSRCSPSLNADEEHIYWCPREMCQDAKRSCDICMYAMCAEHTTKCQKCAVSYCGTCKHICSKK